MKKILDLTFISYITGFKMTGTPSKKLKTFDFIKQLEEQRKDVSAIENE